MKLLTPAQNQDQKQLETQREILRSQETQKAADKIRKELANAEADFKLALARNNEEWIERELMHEERKKEMQREIEVLEAKKLNSLIPFNILKSGTDDRMRDAESFLASLREREENVEELTEKLENKLDELGQKEQDLKLEDKRLKLQKEGQDRQGETIKQRSKDLTAQMQNFVLERQKAEKDIDSRQVVLSLQERSLLAREQTLKRTDKALQDLGIRLADERETLAKAWDELKRNYPNTKILKKKP